VEEVEVEEREAAVKVKVKVAEAVEVAEAVAEVAPGMTTGMAVTASFAAPSAIASGARGRPSPFGPNAHDGWSSGGFAVARS
jgi:hypothetical protein